MIRLARLAALALLACLLLPAPARAKSVTIDWEPVEGAVRYEFLVEAAGRTVVRKEPAQSRWRGQLPYGAYTYKLRAIDKMKNPGEWTDAAPLVVLPPAPEPARPPEGATLTVSRENARATLAWQAVPGVKKYQLKVKSGSTVVFETVTEGLQAETPPLSAGAYTWELTSVIEAGKKSWNSKTPATRSFTVRELNLARPSLLEPVGAVALPQSRRLDFAWEPVEHAEAYELTLTLPPRPRSPRGPAAAEAPEVRKIVIRSATSTVLEIPRNGRYSWKVRALAQLDPSSRQPASTLGPEAVSEFQVGVRPSRARLAGVIGVSMHFAPYSYFISSPSADVRATANTSHSALRIQGELWLAPSWGLGLGLRKETLPLNQQDHTQGGLLLAALYRRELERSSRPWTVTAGLGPELRQYAAVTPYYSGSDELLGTRSERITAIGAGVSVSIQKRLTARWGVEGSLLHFRPLALPGTPQRALVGEKSGGNTLVRAQASYTLGPSWSASAGVAAESQGVGYTISAAPGATTPEELTGSSRYLFAVLSYRFD